MKIALTPAAKDIFRQFGFIRKNIGARRADAYLRAIDRALRGAANGKRQTRIAEEYGARLKSVRSGSHVIFFRPETESLIVVGVLQQSMEPSRHLGAD